MSIYQIGFLGAPSDNQRVKLTASLGDLISPFGLALGTDVAVLDSAACLTHPSKQAFAAAYFGESRPDLPSINAARALVRENLPIIPVVSDLKQFGAQIPEFLHFANGIDLARAGARLEGLAAALLECVGLLRRQRHVFISYRRDDSTPVALQLHESLTAAGFDVFLDSYGVQLAEDFQAMLWHRLCNCDVMVMLDTTGYFKSLWTPQELGRALAKNIAVLSIVWPGHTPERTNQLREPLLLKPDHLNGKRGPLKPQITEHIRLEVERLRSRSLAIRHALLAGAIRAGAEAVGGGVEGVSAHRALTVRLPSNHRVRVFPVVGVPTAETFQLVAEQGLDSAGAVGVPVLAYDHVGLHVSWQKHLQWLQQNLRIVRGLQVAQAAWDFGAWEV